jgi:hypothetical protein
MKVTTNQDAASQFAAAVAVSLAKVSVADDVEDSGDLLARAANGLLNRANRNAARILDSLGFDSAMIADLSTRQSSAEHDPNADPAQPTAHTSAGLFAMTAHLAGNPQNEAALAIIGANYGAYLYLMDAYRDFPRDMVSGDYNPLRRFTTREGAGFSLLAEGLTWLLGRFQQIEAEISEQIGALHLYRYDDLLPGLLLDPVRHIIGVLREKLAAQHPLYFRRWRLADALKTSLFVVPVAVAGLTSVSGSGGEPHLEMEEFPPRKKKRKRGADHEDDCMPGIYWCYFPGDVSGCADCGDLCSSGGACDSSSGLGGCCLIDDHHGDGAATLCCFIDLDCGGMDGCDSCDGCEGADCST